MRRTRAEILIDLQRRLGPSEQTAHLLDWVLDLWETRDFLLKLLGKASTEEIVLADNFSSFERQPHDLVLYDGTPDTLKPSSWN